jgi:hypothetical protein
VRVKRGSFGNLYINFILTDNTPDDTEPIAIVNAIGRMAFTPQSTDEDRDVILRLIDGIADFLSQEGVNIVDAVSPQEVGMARLKYAGHATTCNWNTFPLDIVAWCVCDHAPGQYRPIFPRETEA